MKLSIIVPTVKSIQSHSEITLYKNLCVFLRFTDHTMRAWCYVRYFVTTLNRARLHTALNTEQSNCQSSLQQLNNALFIYHLTLSLSSLESVFSGDM
ncbi:hypothetical protein MHYP_G00025500 [Metynnis hypsauchen]